VERLPPPAGTYVVSLTATDKDGVAGPLVQTTIHSDNVGPTLKLIDA